MHFTRPPKLRCGSTLAHAFQQFTRRVRRSSVQRLGGRVNGAHPIQIRKQRLSSGRGQQAAWGARGPAMNPNHAPACAPNASAPCNTLALLHHGRQQFSILPSATLTLRPRMRPQAQRPFAPAHMAGICQQCWRTPTRANPGRQTVVTPAPCIT